MLCRTVLLFASVFFVTVILSAPALAYHHQASKVRFRDYSQDAFEAAKRERKPVFMLISAVWCYWCDYFDKNTLETEEVYSYLNQKYVSVFVDHDRRMDVARKYIRGLPMIVLFDPDARVRQSFAGALKKEDFLAVLTRVEGETRGDSAGKPPESPPILLDPIPVNRQTYDQLLKGLAKFVDEHLDSVHGGFGTGDKHPHGRFLAFLLDRYEATKDRRYLTAVEKTLDGAVRGIYDRVEGGFFRYAEGREWRVPHYEKLVDINAALLVALDRAHRSTGKALYQEAGAATLSYMLKTLYDDKVGAFYGSQTADPAYSRLPVEERRAARKPSVNRDVVAPWNAEATLAFFSVGQAAGRQDLKDMALRAVEFMRLRMLTDKGVYHLYSPSTGQGQLRGQLEANAWTALVFLEAHRLSGRAVYRQAAEQLLRYSIAKLFDKKRGAFVEGKNPDEGIVKIAVLRASEFPLDANGVMVEVLLRAHRMTGRAEYQEVARRVLAGVGGRLKTVFVDETEEATGADLDGAASYLRAFGLLFGRS